jgi:hypothetical protein
MTLTPAHSAMPESSLLPATTTCFARCDEQPESMDNVSQYVYISEVSHKLKQPETGHSKNKRKRVGETNGSTKNQTGQGQKQTGTYILYLTGIFRHMDRYSDHLKSDGGGTGPFTPTTAVSDNIKLVLDRTTYIVTFSGSPPNALIFLLTQRRAALSGCVDSWWSIIHY